MSFSVGNRLIAALDTPSRAEADALLARLDGVPGWVKIGSSCSAPRGRASSATTRRGASA